jgi:hypothetical protein
VFLRPIVPGDAAALAEAITSADTDTLYRRFLGAAPRVTPALLARLTTVDYTRRFALVAGDAAGVARRHLGRAEREFHISSVARPRQVVTGRSAGQPAPLDPVTLGVGVR